VGKAKFAAVAPKRKEPGFVAILTAMIEPDSRLAI